MTGPRRNPEHRILIIFPGALGDLICFAPTIRELIRRNPAASIELMARLELARFAVGRLGIAAAHSIDRAEVSALFVKGRRVPESAQGFFSGYKTIHTFFAANDSRFCQALSAINRDSRFYPFRPPDDGHVADAYLRLLGGIEKAKYEKPELLSDDRVKAAQVLSEIKLKEQPFCLILPGSGSRTKNWPAANFIQVAERLAPDLKALVVLGPAEEEMQRLFRNRDIRTLSGLELGTVAGLAQRAEIFLGNDSGVSHLAAAAGAPGIVLFGPTDPDRWCPLGDVRVIRREPLTAIHPDEVAHLLRAVAWW